MKAARQTAYRVLALVFASSMISGAAFAGAGPPPSYCHPVPEIDPGTAAGAITLLVGGVMSLADRRRSK